jgi:hypothetical protein
MLPAAILAGDINEDLITAARKGDLAVVKELLAKGADVNAKTQYGATGLSYACDRGHLEIVKVLIEHGADVNVKDTFYGATPMVWAASKNHAAVVRLLLDKGAQSKEMAMTIAAREGQTDVARVALERGGFKPDALRTYLGTAVRGGRAEIVRMLVGALSTEEPVKVAPETLATYAGVYKGEGGMELILTVKDGTFSGRSTQLNSPVALRALDQRIFQLTESDGVIIFNVEGEKVTGLTMAQMGKVVKLKKEAQ